MTIHKRDILRKKHVNMQPETAECLQRLEVYDFDSVCYHGFRLFEEFSGQTIDKTISRSRRAFEKADSVTRRHQLKRVETDLANFSHWLVKSKGVNRFLAHYYTTSLKSVLLGLATGVELGLLFGFVLRSIPNEALT